MSRISEKQFDEALGFTSFSYEFDLEGRIPKHNPRDYPDWDYNKNPEIIQREKERIERSKLQSNDGETREFYDQVFIYVLKKTL